MHSGGIDLKFPHHENEMKQCCARYDEKDCVKYFIHIGHLNIEGLKMSKSLKNFVTIKQILEISNPNELRMLCLLHKYNQPMEYSNRSLLQAKNIMNKFTDFVHKIKLINNFNYDKYNPFDLEICDNINAIKNNIEFEIKNDFNTPSVITDLQRIIDVLNMYILREYKASIVLNSFEYVEKILNMFGIKFKNVDDSSISIILDIVCDFRNKIINFSQKNKIYELFGITDELRDVTMRNIGVSIQDNGKDTKSTWNYFDK